MIFIKLGGSLITEKIKPRTARFEILRRLANEISQARSIDPDLRLLLGHGSGSFGHVPAKKFHTRQGVRSKEDWAGFIEVWRDASALNRIVIDVLGEAGISAMSFPPSACVSAQNREITQWNIAPIARAAAAGILPVIYGDVLFDDRIGGTIFSTEELFAHLAERLNPERILLVGLEPGVWERYPQKTRLIPKITPQSFLQQDSQISGSAATDVTGGMYGKVRYSLEMIETNPGLEISIFSGEQPGSIIRALAGEKPGTLICAD